MAKKKNQKKEQKGSASPSLVGNIFFDLLIKHWFLSLLVCLVVISAMQKARTSHDVRRATAELQKLKDKYQTLQVDWQSLNLEMTALTESDRLSELAKKELDMKKVNSTNEKIISL